MLCVSSQMNTLKAFGTPRPYRFLSVLFSARMCCWTKLMWTKRRISALWSLVTSLWFHSAYRHFSIFFSLSIFPSLFHLFTHLLEEGHKEISISFSREKAVRLPVSLLSSPPIFHIFNHSFCEGHIRKRDACLSAPVCMYLPVLSVYMLLYICVVMLVTIYLVL